VEPSAALDLPHLLTFPERQRAELSKVVDLVITIGGDGTILKVSSMFDFAVPPVLSFTTGSLGFLMSFSIADYKEAIDNVFSGGFTVIPRSRLRCTFYDANNEPISYTENVGVFQVMNEVAVHRRGIDVRVLSIDCFIDDVLFSSFLGDGVIVATPTGSTAYSMSCGGPMVHPSLQTILLTPMNPRPLAFQPTLFPRGTVIKLKLAKDSRLSGMVSFDGHRSQNLSVGESLVVRGSDFPVMTVNRLDSITGDWVCDINHIFSGKLE